MVEQHGSRRGLTPRRWQILTAAIWAVSLTYLVVAGLVAAEFVLMPVSLDMSELLTAGSQPWRDAAIAAVAFTALLVLAAISLRLWHTVRFRTIAWALTLLDLVAVGWFGYVVLRDYF